MYHRRYKNTSSKLKLQTMKHFDIQYIERENMERRLLPPALPIFPSYIHNNNEDYLFMPAGISTLLVHLANRREIETANIPLGSSITSLPRDDSPCDLPDAPILLFAKINRISWTNLTRHWCLCCSLLIAKRGA